MRAANGLIRRANGHSLAPALTLGLLKRRHVPSGRDAQGRTQRTPATFGHLMSAERRARRA